MEPIPSSLKMWYITCYLRGTGVTQNAFISQGIRSCSGAVSQRADPRRAEAGCVQT